jgi:DNA-3-methyladenine glycosylase
LDAPSLSQAFFARRVTVVAIELLGQIVVRERAGDLLVARIVETEAYQSDIDEASHGFRGQTVRNRSMFGTPGRAYVYRSYGIHFMLNVVTTRAGGPASAVLIRGMDPLMGIDAMKELRGAARTAALLRGPGNVCKALGIDTSLDGHDLTVPPLRIAKGPAPAEPVITTTRIGISRSVDLPWRYYLCGAPGVSNPDRIAERRAWQDVGKLS